MVIEWKSVTSGACSVCPKTTRIVLRSLISIQFKRLCYETILEGFKCVQRHFRAMHSVTCSKVAGVGNYHTTASTIT